MARIVITGGSGFIGTNLVELMLCRKCEVLSLDTAPPQAAGHRRVFCECDMCDEVSLRRIIQRFTPSHVVHLAARTDFNGHSMEDYRVNFAGIESLINVLRMCDSVRRCLFMSSRLVCRIGYEPRSVQDYSPDTLYGQSKADGEKVIRCSHSLNYEWLIARPTSIWGPWFGVPYKPFFLTIAKGHYLHPGRANPRKSYGYVGNTVFQIQKLLEAPREVVHEKTFYLSDYEPYTIRQWADAISTRLHGRNARTIPECVIKVGAWGGDCLQKVGYDNPPMTSFRLNNMKSDTVIGVSLDAIRDVTGPLPYSMGQGVAETVAWLREQRLIRR